MLPPFVVCFRDLIERLDPETVMHDVRLNNLEPKNKHSYLTMLMPGVHSITPFLNFSLDRRKFILQELPHDVQITAIQPVMIDGNGILLLLRDALSKLRWHAGQIRFLLYYDN